MDYLFRKTKRLIIRPLATEDFGAWKGAHLSMGQAKNQWDPGPRPLGELTRKSFNEILRAQRKRREEDRFYDFAVFNKGGEYVGIVALMDVVRGVSHAAFLGYSIFNHHWRLGYGKEAVRALIDIAFKDIKLHRIEAGIEPRNIRSIKLAKSLGMRREGLKKRAIFLRSRWVDLTMYTLTTEDVGLKFDTRPLKHKPRS